MDIIRSLELSNIHGLHKQLRRKPDCTYEEYDRIHCIGYGMLGVSVPAQYVIGWTTQRQ